MIDYYLDLSEYPHYINAILNQIHIDPLSKRYALEKNSGYLTMLDNNKWHIWSLDFECEIMHKKKIDIHSFQLLFYKLYN